MTTAYMYVQRDAVYMNYRCTVYRIVGIFSGGLIFAFFMMERIRENYARECLPCMRMCVCGAGMHLTLHE